MFIELSIDDYSVLVTDTNAINALNAYFAVSNDATTNTTTPDYVVKFGDRKIDVFVHENEVIYNSPVETFSIKLPNANKKVVLETLISKSLNGFIADWCAVHNCRPNTDDYSIVTNDFLPFMTSYEKNAGRIDPSSYDSAAVVIDNNIYRLDCGLFYVADDSTTNGNLYIHSKALPPSCWWFMRKALPRKFTRN